LRLCGEIFEVLKFTAAKDSAIDLCDLCGKKGFLSNLNSYDNSAHYNDTEAKRIEI